MTNETKWFLGNTVRTMRLDPEDVETLEDCGMIVKVDEDDTMDEDGRVKCTVYGLAH